MKVFNKIFTLPLTLILMLTACGNGKAGNTSWSDSSSNHEQEEEDHDTKALKNYVSNLDLKGYVGTNLKNNINYWQKSAYNNNPNIVYQIKSANSSDPRTSLSRILGTDYFGVDYYYDIDIVESAGKNRLSWFLKSLPTTFADRDIRIERDPLAITDWTGVETLLVKIDASEIAGVSSIRVAVEDDSYGADSFYVIKNKIVSLYSGGIKTDVRVKEFGFVDVPAHFVGYMAIPMARKNWFCYFDGGDNTLNYTNLAQFQITVKGTQKSVGHSLYMDEFGIVGDVGGGQLPSGIDLEGTYKPIWDFSGTSPKLRDEGNNVPSGLIWYGEFAGKLLTGMAFSYKAYPSSDLAASAKKIIDDLEEAQGEDGYLGVFKGGARYSIDSPNWDIWNQYHCVVGLCEWYKLTDNEKALTIAKKTLDCIMNTFANRSYIVKGGYETNRGIAHAFGIMYQITKENKYLNEAKRIIDVDCRENDPNSWYNSALIGGSFYTSGSPRWEVLHTIMALGILYEETENEEYYQVLKYLWKDILDTDVHNDGGFSTNECALGDPYREGIIETCCTIAWQALTNEFYKISKGVEVVDELERSYYNALLGSLLDDDKYCTYNTPVNGIQGSCGSYDGRRVPSQQDISFQYNPGSPDMNCCQANFARGIGQIAEWAALTSENSLYLNYYGNCAITTKVGGDTVTIKEVTSYPSSGNIKLAIQGLSSEKEFNLKIRIPSWAKGSKVTIGSNTYDAEEGKYYSINRKWKNNDIVQVNLGMHFTCWKGEMSQDGKASIYYGPILLTLDEYHSSTLIRGLSFDGNIQFSVKDFKNVVISEAIADGGWLHFDVTTTRGTVRLVDFASAGKYNGQLNPCSYYSWLNVSDTISGDGLPINRWKTIIK